MNPYDWSGEGGGMLGLLFLLAIVAVGKGLVVVCGLIAQARERRKRKYLSEAPVELGSPLSVYDPDRLEELPPLVFAPKKPIDPDWWKKIKD